MDCDQLRATLEMDQPWGMSRIKFVDGRTRDLLD